MITELEEREGGEEVTMCELLDKYEAKGIEKGLEKGIKALVETCEELGLTQTEALSKIAQKFSISWDEGRNYIQKYWSIS